MLKYVENKLDCVKFNGTMTYGRLIKQRQHNKKRENKTFKTFFMNRFCLNSLNGL